MNNKIYVFANVFKRHIGNVKMTLCNRLLSNTSFEQVLVTLNLIRKAKATTGTWKAELQGLFLLKPFWAQIAVIGKGFMSKIFLRGWENMLEFEKVMTKKSTLWKVGWVRPKFSDSWLLNLLEKTSGTKRCTHTPCLIPDYFMLRSSKLQRKIPTYIKES